MNLTSSRRPLSALLILVALTVGLSLFDARPAAAHDALSSATPAAGDTVTTAISTVTLTFSEIPMAEFANAIALNVTSPSGASVTMGGPTVQERTLAAPVTMTENGLHTVTWQSVSSDGHTISGTYTFNFDGPIAATTASEPAAAAPESDTTATPPPPAEAETQSSTTIPIIAGVSAAAVLLLAALIVFRVFRSRERDLDAQAPDNEEVQK
jgi:methionine-rich copper-binding protein CopC